MLNGYPRPQLERKEWLNLNGEWQFLFDDEKRGRERKMVRAFPRGNRQDSGAVHL